MDQLGTNAVVVEFAFKVTGRTRDEAIETADRIGNEAMTLIGGEPWTMVDDDWQRKSTAGGAAFSLADDQGFFYYGIRKYVFQGPFLPGIRYPRGDGFRTQKQVGDET